MKVEELILYAFKKIGYVFSEENLRAALYAEALFYLNEEISTLNRSGVYIPYFSEVSFDFVSGQADYTIGPAGTNSDVTANAFVEINYVQVLWEQILYSITISTRKHRYNAVLYPQPTDAIPAEVLFRRNNTQAILSFYQPPQLELPVTVKGKQELSSFQQYQDITNIPAYFLKYFRLCCSKQLAAQYIGTTWTDVDEMELTKITAAVFSASEVNVDIISSPQLLECGSAATDPLASIYGST